MSFNCKFIRIVSLSGTGLLLLTAGCTQPDTSYKSGIKVPKKAETDGKTGMASTPEAVGQDEATRRAAAEAKAAANTPNKPVAPVSGTGTDDDPEEAVKPSSPVDVRLKFQQTRGDASFRNCLAIRVNNGSLFSLGCNHDGDLTKELSVPALSKPAVNTVRLVFSTNGAQRGTTEDKSANQLFRVTKKDSKTFQIGYEDNDDGDFNDYVFFVSSDGNINLAIENCSDPSCRIE